MPKIVRILLLTIFKKSNITFHNLFRIFFLTEFINIPLIQSILWSSTEIFKIKKHL